MPYPYGEMARTFSATLNTVKNSNTARTVMLLDLDVAGTIYHFADQTVRFEGNDYLPHLAVEDGARYLRSLQIDSATVKLQNVTREVSQLLKTEFVPGSPALLRKLFVQANETVTMFDGLAEDPQIEETEATFRLVSTLDPGARKVPERNYSSPCPWKFKSAECGYVGVLETCNKTHADCVERAQTHRFGGFLQIDRALTESVPPAPAPGESGQEFNQWFADQEYA